MIEINIECDDCGEVIKTYNNVFCVKCYRRIIDEKNAHINLLAKKNNELEKENEMLVFEQDELRRDIDNLNEEIDRRYRR